MPHQLVALNDLRHIERVAARAAAWQARIDGKPLSVIASELGVCVSTVSAYLRETIEELSASAVNDAETWRNVELARLDSLLKAWLPVAQEVKHPEATRAAAIVIRAIEAQNRLLGLEVAALVPQPAKQSKEEELQRSPAVIDAVERMLAQMKEAPEAQVAVK